MLLINKTLYHLKKLVNILSKNKETFSDAEKTYYEIKRNRVLYHSVYRKTEDYGTPHFCTDIVKGADKDSFKELSKEYGMDATHVYFKIEIVQHRDNATFKVLNEYITADKHGVYQQNNLIPNSDGLSFKLLGAGYAIDNNNIYYIPTNFYNILKEADKKTFEIINSGFLSYAKDKKQVYCNEHTIEAADPSSFIVLDNLNGYSKDNKHIFHFHVKMKDANVNSFKILKYDLSKDDTFIFYRGKIVKEADYTSFKIIEDNSMYDAEDKNHYYRSNGGAHDDGSLGIWSKEENTWL